MKWMQEMSLSQELLSPDKNNEKWTHGDEHLLQFYVV
jgi:hypothetical protein